MTTQRRIYSVEGNTQRLDGGSMFGNCPRPVWERWAPPDERHRIKLACRSMLVREPDRNILLEAGIGAFFEPKLRDRYGVQESEHVLLASLNQLEMTPDDIDIIVLSHMHFDHAGGLLTPYSEGKVPTLAFPNARYVVGTEAWQRALNPHARDKASFIPELQVLLKQGDKLEMVSGETSATLGEGYSFTYSHGHTPGLMLTRVETARGAVTFMGDLIPGTPWVHLPITMGYDRYPELLINEKAEILDRVVADESWLFYTHDPEACASRVVQDDRGRYKPSEIQSSLRWD